MKLLPVLLLYGIDEQTLPVDAEVTRHSIRRAEEVLRSRAWIVQICQITDDLESVLSPFPPSEWLVFNMCEGSPSQPFYYARVARELERRGYAYTGSDSVSLHQTQFKPEMKKLLEARNVPTPRWTAVEPAQYGPANWKTKTKADRGCVEDQPQRPRTISTVELSQLGFVTAAAGLRHSRDPWQNLSFDFFPAIVKPAAEHCSFGITRDSVVFTLGEAGEQVRIINRDYDGGALIEEFLDGQEYGISLWGNEEDLEVFGISVIHYDAFPEVRDRLCTFDAKWLPETDAYKKTMPTCPAPLTPGFRAELESLAKHAHRACGGRDYSRVDVRLQDGRPMVLDVNLNCAVSENSGFVETARLAAGCDYAAVLERLLRMAAKRFDGPRKGAKRHKKKFQASTSNIQRNSRRQYANGMHCHQ